MCNPQAVIAVIGLVVSAYGTVQQSNAQEAILDQQAEQSRADANAERGAAQVQAERIRKAGKLQRAQAQAQLAGSGVDVNEGTALVIDREIVRNSEEDAFLTIAGGEDRALRMENQALLDKMKSKSVNRAGNLGAASSVLGGAMDIGSSMGWKFGNNKGTG